MWPHIGKVFSTILHFCIYLASYLQGLSNNFAFLHFSHLILARSFKLFCVFPYASPHIGKAFQIIIVLSVCCKVISTFSSSLCRGPPFCFLPAHSLTLIFIIITFRGGSKGIPLKNLAPLGSRPLLSWALGAVLEFGT